MDDFFAEFLLPILILGSGIFIGLIVILIQRYHTKRYQAELIENMEAEVNDAYESAERVVSQLIKQLDNANQVMKIVYQALIENYTNYILYTLFLKRRLELHDRHDFNSKFIQTLYDQNELNITNSSKFQFFDIASYCSLNTLDAFEKLSRVYANTHFAKEILTTSPFFCITVDDIRIPMLQDEYGNTILIYPTFVATYNKGSMSFSSISHKNSHELGFTVSQPNYTNYNNTIIIPSYAEIVGYEWEHMTIKGKPDARFKYNPRYTQYKRISLSFWGSDYKYYSFDVKGIENFVSAFSQFKSTVLKNTSTENVVPNVAPYNPSHSTGAEILEKAYQEEIERRYAEIMNKKNSNLAVDENDGNSQTDSVVNESSDMDRMNSAQKHKGHYVGEKHPTQPLVWTEYKPGKFDWRKDKTL